MKPNPSSSSGGREAAFSPGPWEINPVKTVLGTFMVCAGKSHAYGLVADVTEEPDARLIAAAPDLLEAAREMDEFAWSALSPDCEEAGREIMRRLTNLRAAIAKASDFERSDQKTADFKPGMDPS